MKKLLVVYLLFSAGAVPLAAQTLDVVAPEFAPSKLFDSTPGSIITGLGADDDGNIYYLESDARFPAQSSTTLLKRTPTDAYANPISLFDYGAPLFGAFVVFATDKVFFAESSTGSIRVINQDGTGMMLLGTVPGIYDLSFFDGTAFISANPQTDFGQPPENKVIRFNIATGQSDVIVDTGGDFSGPIEFADDGRLLYGGTGVGVIRDLHAFTSAEVAGAFGPGELALAPPSHRLISNGRNLFLAHAGGPFLWKDDFATLTLHDLGTLESRTIATTSDSLGQLDAANNRLFLNVTSFSTARSSVYSIVPVPEPSAVSLLLVGFALCARLAARPNAGARFRR